MKKWIFILWLIYSIMTIWFAESIYEVYPTATRIIIILPLLGFQIAFFAIALTIQVMVHMKKS